MSIIAEQVRQAAALDEMQRSLVFRKRWEAYYGRHPQPLTTAPGKANDNVIVNYARLIVDVGVAYLFGTPPSIELDETTQTDAERWLEQALLANRWQMLLQRLALNGAVCGQVFVKLLDTRPYPRIVVLDPGTVTVFWEPDDYEQVWRYRIQFPTIDRDGQALVMRQEIERDGSVWRITDSVGEANGRWRVTNTTIWQRPWAPVLHCQNLPAANEFWGVSDLEDDILQLNYAINRVLSNIARILRFHAHPRTWGKGFLATQLQTAVDGTLVLPSPEAELRNLEMTSDLSSSIATYQRLREALHEIARIPEVATGKLEHTGGLSGVALHILYQPLLQKTEAKRALYGELLTDLASRLLELGGYSGQPRLHWPELLPRDTLVERQAAMVDMQLGVSQDTLLRQLGYDPDVEATKRAEQALAEAEIAAVTYARGGVVEVNGNGRAT